MKTEILFASLAGALLVTAAVPQAQAPIVPAPPAPAPSQVTPPAPPTRVLNLSFDGHGLATLTARNVTVREILREWARLGGSTFVNGDQVAGPPISVEFDRVPETTILESLFRTTAGYIAAPKLAGAPGLSQLGAVYIVTSSHGTQAPTSSSYAVAAPLASVDDEIPPVTPPLAPLSQPAQTPATSNAPAAPTNPGVYAPMVTVPPPTTGRGRQGGGGR